MTVTWSQRCTTRTMLLTLHWCSTALSPNVLMATNHTTQNHLTPCILRQLYHNPIIRGAKPQVFEHMHNSNCVLYRGLHFKSRSPAGFSSGVYLSACLDSNISHSTVFQLTHKLKICPSFHTCANLGLALYMVHHTWSIQDKLMDKTVSIFWHTSPMGACSHLGPSYMWNMNRTKLRDSCCVHHPYWWPFGTILGKVLLSSSAHRRTKRPLFISMAILDVPNQRRPREASPEWPQHPLVSVSPLACTQGCLLPSSFRPKWCLQGKALTSVTPREIHALICPPNCLCRHFCPWGALQSPCCSSWFM